MEVDTPTHPYTHSRQDEEVSSGMSPIQPTTTSTLAELMGSPLFNASMKLRRTRSAVSGQKEKDCGSTSLKRQGCRTFSVLPFSDLGSNKENTFFSTDSGYPKGQEAISGTSSHLSFRRHVRGRSGSGFRPSFSYQHHHSRSRSNSTLSSNGSIFKIHSRSTSSSSRGLQESLGLITGNYACHSHSDSSNSNLSNYSSGQSSNHSSRHGSMHQAKGLAPGIQLPMDCSTPNLHTRYSTEGLNFEAAYSEAIEEDSDHTSEDRANVSSELESEAGDMMADDSNLAQEIYGSPLQQRRQIRSRLELNGRIRHNLRRATSLMNYSSCEVGGSGYADMGAELKRHSPQRIQHHKLHRQPSTIFRRSPGKFSSSRVLGSPTAPGSDARRHGLRARVPRLTRSTTCLSPATGLISSPSTIGLGHVNSVLADSNIKTFFVDDCPIPQIDVDQFHSLLVDYRSRDTGSTDKNGTARSTSPKLSGQFDDLVVVDCRFQYEYQGGHIDGALNISSKSELEDAFFSSQVVKQSPRDFTSRSHKLLVFHCEFSSRRGPLMANNLRSWDRCLNRDNYPELYYPDVVILEGGYKKYYDRYIVENSQDLYSDGNPDRSKCSSNCSSYVEMQDPQFKDECERGLDKLRRDNKLSLSRKSSYSSSLNLNLSRKSSCTAFDGSGSVSSLSNSGSSSSSSTSSISSSSLSSGSSLSLKRSSSTSTTLTSTSSLDFSNSTKVGIDGLRKKTLYFGDEDHPLFTSATTNTTGSGLFGGFGNHKIDLDNLCEDSPMKRSPHYLQSRPSSRSRLRHTNSHSQQRKSGDTIPEEPEMGQSRSKSQEGRYGRSETIGYFTYEMKSMRRTGSNYDVKGM